MIDVKLIDGMGTLRPRSPSGGQPIFRRGRSLSS
jgi:hypothetical protein